MFKCLEKVIAQQLIEQTSDMTELYQSAYKSNHSTEAAFIAVYDDIKRGFDNRKGTALVMIDLSAAFGTIKSLNFTSETQKQIWYIPQCIKMVSVLSSRKMPTCIHIWALFLKVKIDHRGSTRQCIRPLLFSLYVQLIGDIIRKHGLGFHHCADNLQLYDHFNFTSPSFASAIY